MLCILLVIIGRAQRARTSELNGNFVCMYVCMYVPAQRANVAGLASSGRCARPQMLCILLVIIGRAQRARTSELNGNFVCMYVCMYVPAQRANVAGLASSGRCARPQMLCILLVIIGRAQRARTSELNGNFVCMYVCMYVPAQRANVAGLASSGRCARPQMLCILLVIISNNNNWASAASPY